MGAAPVPKLSVEEYLVMDRAAELPSEYHDGEIFPIVNASWNHNKIALNTSSVLVSLLRGSPCEVAAMPTRVRVSPTKFVYPDILVVCGGPKFTDEKIDTIRNPKVIIEILSASTADYDYGTKFTLYRGLESFVEYVLIAQDRPLAEVFRKQPGGDWLLTTYTDPAQPIPLASLGVSVTIADLHDGVSYPEE